MANHVEKAESIDLWMHIETVAEKVCSFCVIEQNILLSLLQAKVTFEKWTLFSKNRHNVIELKGTENI